MKAINSFIGLKERWVFQGIQTQGSLVSVNDLNVWHRQHREGWTTVALQSGFDPQESKSDQRVGEKRDAEGWDGASREMMVKVCDLSMGPGLFKLS